MITGKESRLGWATEATPKEKINDVTLMVPDGDAFAAYANGAWAAVVRTGADRYNKRIFVTLNAAQNMVAKARMRGQAARVVLVELRTLYVAVGDSLEDELDSEGGGRVDDV